jgi:Pyruvate/2-oxoacid:ferredoxin oxidoreductase gamma subunit
MTRSLSYNIIVTGLGGQGVNTLTKVIFELCETSGRPCGGAIFKGGAQRAGTIHSEIRIWANSEDHVHCSNRILPGSLDLMLGLEPHEAMRFADNFSNETEIIVNDAPVGFHAERTGLPRLDPVEALRQRFRLVIARDFSDAARHEYGDPRMTNFLMLAEAAESDRFPFSSEEVHQAISRWRITKVAPALG